MKTIEEWNKYGDAERERLEAATEAAETPEDMLPVTVQGLEFAARNYAEVLEHGSDGTGASAEDAIHRASRALQDGGRILAIMEMRDEVSRCEEVGDCESCDALEYAIEFLEHVSDEATEADSRARESA